MDGQRFDDLARALSTGASRRRVLRGLAAGAAAALAGAIGWRRAGAQACSAYGRVCAATQCCATPGAVCFCYANGHCRCRCPEGAARVDGACRCPENASVVDGACRCPAGTSVVDGACRCTAGSCPAGSVCLNGGCFAACLPPTFECGAGCGTACGCDVTTDDRTTLLCQDLASFVGNCVTNADCPAGTVCSRLRDGAGRNLCAGPCPCTASVS